MLRALAALTLLLSAHPVLAQNPPPVDPGARPVTRAFAITEARVVQAPGRVLERATVVVRNGLIEAVGAGVSVPYDAERIAGDSLTVYAGFIDALGHAGIPEPKANERPEPVRDPGNPPRERAGIQPDRDAGTLLDPSHSSIEALREVGFTAAHTVPHDGMLAGQGAIILLAGDDAAGLVLRPRASLFAQLAGGQGVYPATPMAVLAMLRQLAREAERRQAAEALYAENPAGLARPGHDPALDALRPALAGQQPVFFFAGDALAAHRALAITAELGLPVVLAGLREGSLLEDKLAAGGIPVLAALGLPERPDSTATDSAAAEPSAFVTPRRTITLADLGGETTALQARRRDAIGLYEANAARLHEAGRLAGFSTKGAKPGEIRENLRRMVEAGLSEDAALAALTTEPAALLGLGRNLGTVEAGKMANLVVTDGPYFAENSRVRYVVVEGRRFEVEDERDGSDSAGVVVAGTWSYRLVTDEGAQTGMLTIERSGDALSGTVTLPDGSRLPLADVALDGDRMSFRVAGTPLGEIRVAGTVRGYTFEGEATGEGLVVPIPFTATRQPE